MSRVAAALVAATTFVGAPGLAEPPGLAGPPGLAEPPAPLAERLVTPTSELWGVAYGRPTGRLPAAIRGVDDLIASAADADPETQGRLVRTALALLELADPSGAAPPRALLLRGWLWSLLPDGDGRAIPALSAALAAEPDGDRAASGWEALGFACSRVGDDPCTERAWRRALEVSLDAEARARLSLNLAEQAALRRELVEAERLLTRALAEPASAELHGVVWYSLAAVSFRQGDLRRAYGAIRAGRALFLAGESPIHRAGVEWLPPHEVYLLEALEAAAVADELEQRTDVALDPPAASDAPWPGAVSAPESADAESARRTFVARLWRSAGARLDAWLAKAPPADPDRARVQGLREVVRGRERRAASP